jgi:two-component system sensor histidine kinase RegB
MPETPAILDSRYRPLRLETLVRLRWLAVGGQAAGVLFVHFWLGFPLPLVQCLALIGLSALLNLGLILRFGTGQRLGFRLATAQLAYDSLQLGGLLYLTGGLTNPFSLLLLAPVSVSATALPPRLTFGLAGLVALIASVLSVAHWPLPWWPGEPFQIHRTYIVGMWVSLLCGVAFIAAYTQRVAHEARLLAGALAATELAVSRQQQLSALDGLAAAAAHELGTPLSTIALAAKEMQAGLSDKSMLEDFSLTLEQIANCAEDVDLILSQVARCRAILGKLRNLDSEGGDPFGAVPLHEIIAEAAKPYQGFEKSVEAVVASAGPEPSVRRSVGLLYGLGNLIENAAAYASTRVDVDAEWSEDIITVTITDDGPGFPAEHLARLGEPYFTTRGSVGGDEQGGGLGLGIFIARTLLERTGARLAFRNTGQGASVEIVWPREALAP